MISVNENPYLSYVTTSAQKRYSTYTSAPSATIEPTIPRSVPPWNGSAGQFGADETPSTGTIVWYVVGGASLLVLLAAMLHDPSRKSWW